MQQKLLVRGSILCIGLALACIASIGVIVDRAPRSADEKFAELYSCVQIGMDPWQRANGPITSRSSRIGEADREAIVSILRAGKEDEVFHVDPKSPDSFPWLSDREVWLKFLDSDGVEWRKWEHPHDAKKWFAAAVMCMGTCNSMIVCKVKVGF
jgi:hypothetical protein